MQGKNPVCPVKKKVLREKLGRRRRITGLERAGSAGPGIRDGGRGQAGPGGVGTCVFLHKNVRRKSLDCCFGAEYRGENPKIFTGFSPRGTGYFPCFTGFFSKKKSGQFD